MRGVAVGRSRRDIGARVRGDVHGIDTFGDGELDDLELLLEDLTVGLVVLVALMRIQTGTSASRRARSARITSSSNRARFSTLPPQPSVRVFIDGVRNSSIR